MVTLLYRTLQLTLRCDTTIWRPTYSLARPIQQYRRRPHDVRFSHNTYTFTRICQRHVENGMDPEVFWQARLVYDSNGQRLDGAPHRRQAVATDQRSEAPIPRLVRKSPFSVATCTFQVGPGNSGGSGRSVMRGSGALSSAAVRACHRPT